MEQMIGATSPLETEVEIAKWGTPKGQKSNPERNKALARGQAYQARGDLGAYGAVVGGLGAAAGADAAIKGRNIGRRMTGEGVDAERNARPYRTTAHQAGSQTHSRTTSTSRAPGQALQRYKNPNVQGAFRNSARAKETQRAAYLFDRGRGFRRAGNKAGAIGAVAGLAGVASGYGSYRGYKAAHKEYKRAKGMPKYVAKSFPAKIEKASHNSHWQSIHENERKAGRSRRNQKVAAGVAGSGLTGLALLGAHPRTSGQLIAADRTIGRARREGLSGKQWAKTAFSTARKYPLATGTALAAGAVIGGGAGWAGNKVAEGRYQGRANKRRRENYAQSRVKKDSPASPDLGTLKPLQNVRRKRSVAS